jgi:hypothetical protein
MEMIIHSPAGLVDALRERLEKLLSSYWHEAEKHDDGDNEEFHTPHVHAQYLPVSKTEDEERDKSKDFPIALVSCTGGAVNDFSETANGSDIKIKINFGCYRENTDNQGWRLAEAMMWRTLQDLLSNTICNGYLLVAPVKWFLPMDEVPPYYEPPYYAAMIETVWKGYPPAVEVPVMSGDIYGNESSENS